MGREAAEFKALSDVAPWRLAVVLESSDASARVGLQPPRDPGGGVSKAREIGTVPLEGVKWAKPVNGPLWGKTPGKVSQVLEPVTCLCRGHGRQGGPVPPAPGS